ncbi:Hypothetical protein R9X50_00621500 [Acrodontium crateriforme]|uniref:GAT domain-containing protein n=1 Tax=Acrodontium crateriforme TaxID=150365 RepID=A0AAQ3MAN4_9PEZI|nr:Hypothetical protein R9X50_00621500 [Acrodontium crateriforme]
MKRFSTLLNRTKSSNSLVQSNAPANSPEASVAKAIREFCETSTDPNSNDEDHVLHLPVIVDAAESSPNAAAAAAQQVKQFLTREWTKKPHVQYHAVMLIRILSDNPGPTFTKNFDKSFIGTVKELLRSSKDRATQQILRETLDSLEVNRSHDEGVQGLVQMWRKEKGQSASLSHVGNRRFGPLPGPQGPPYRGEHNVVHRQLPPPQELASRVEESRNTAKILLQLIGTTPTEEVLSNDLIREFGDRCQSAQKSMQNYINCENPAPDHDTLQTLIETNEQLSLASSRYQRAVLAARRAAGIASPPPDNAESNGGSAFAVPAGPPPGQHGQTNVSAFQSNDSAFQPAGGPLVGAHSNFVQQTPAPQLSPLDKSTNDASNPFADPEDHETDAVALAQHASQPSQSFNIDSEPIYARPRSNTKDLENAYANHAVPTSMREVPAELDSNSNVGRRDRDTTGSEAPNSYTISPADTR